MTRKPRAVWLLDVNDPNGKGRMALRRIRLLDDVLNSTAVSLRLAPLKPPTSSPFSGIVMPTSPSGRLALLASDFVVTTSEKTFSWAIKQRISHAKHIHFVHAPLETVLASEKFIRMAHLADSVVLPMEADSEWFSHTVGVGLESLHQQDDFTLPSERLVAPAKGNVILAVGRFTPGGGLLELVRGFARALPEMPDWQLRLAGWGPQRSEIKKVIAEEGLGARVLILGPTYEIESEYLGAAVTARLAQHDASGLSVLESLSSGVPVLGAPTVPAVRRLVTDGVNGHVLERLGPEPLADALVRMADDDHRQRLAGGARTEPAGFLDEDAERDLKALFDTRKASLLTRFAPRLGGKPPSADTKTPRLIPQVPTGASVESPSSEHDSGTPEGPISSVASATTVRIKGRTHLLMDGLKPREARTQTLRQVLDSLSAANVRGFLVKGGSFPGPTVGVLGESRDLALRALGEHLQLPNVYFQEVDADGKGQLVQPVSAAAFASIPDNVMAIRIAQLWSSVGRSLIYGMQYGTIVEFWMPDAERDDHVVSPRRNAAAELVQRSLLTPAELELDGEAWPSVDLFARSMVDEVTFPVDAVYTWVDGADPAWRERFERARAEAEGVEYHPQATSDNRYLSRDELRYSLRSLDYYAPWIRHIYLVTDRQVPKWLDASSERVTVVDHRDIYSDCSLLPVFNSSAIITQLHHIDDLSEHYLYLNDDMFFGRDVRPDFFFHGSGIAKVFPSKQARPFGPAHPAEEPHLNISKNIRSALEETVGRSLSLAIRHTPYPQIKSVNAEIEERFGDVVRETAGHRFRHHEDIALDQLFHYYAQATGRAVASSISYDYVNVGIRESVSRLRWLLNTRSRSVFCLNDAPEPDMDPMPFDQVERFLDSYYPLSSSFELA